MATADQIGVRGLGLLTTVGHTSNPNLLNRTISLSSGTPIVIDGSGNMQWDRPWYCFAESATPGLLPTLPSCTMSLSDSLEVGNYESIGPAASAESIATLQGDFARTQAQQCAQYPESCAIAGSQAPVFTAVKAAVGQIGSPVVCGPFQNATLQPDGSFKCSFDPTNIPTWLLVAGVAVIGLVLFR